MLVESAEILMNRAYYQDGELVPYKPGAGIDPKPAAANDGTIINVRPVIPLITHPVFPTTSSSVLLLHHILSYQLE
jgi:hypothetical protein